MGRYFYVFFAALFLLVRIPPMGSTRIFSWFPSQTQQNHKNFSRKKPTKNQPKRKNIF
jgi:hypothetical protein